MTTATDLDLDTDELETCSMCGAPAESLDGSMCGPCATAHDEDRDAAQAELDEANEELSEAIAAAVEAAQAIADAKRRLKAAKREMARLSD